MKFESIEQAKAVLSVGTCLKHATGRTMKVIPWDDYQKHQRSPMTNTNCVVIVQRDEDKNPYPRWIAFKDIKNYEVIPFEELKSVGIRPASEYMDLLK